MQSVQVGDTYPFRPSAFMGDGHHRTAPLTGTVIAVNCDASARIFDYADYGIIQKI